MSDIPQIKLHYDKKVNLHMISGFVFPWMFPMCVSVCEKIHCFKSCVLNCANTDKVIQKSLI